LRRISPALGADTPRWRLASLPAGSGVYPPIGARLARPTVDRRLLLRALPVGLVAGVASGLLGIGGGLLLVPGLLWLGFAQHEAHATSLAAIVLIAAASVVPFALGGEVNPGAGALLAVGAVVGAYVGAAVTDRMPERGLRLSFVALAVVVAGLLLAGVQPSPGGVAIGPVEVAGLAAIGLAIGGVSAVLGVGGGVVFVPALVLAFGLSQQAAEGTSLVAIVPTALAGTLRHARSGRTEWRTGAALGLGGIVGGVAGAGLALLLPGPVLQRVFALVLVVIAVRLARRR
jgi:uncharacterized membrane protein YfcA